MATIPQPIPNISGIFLSKDSFVGRYTIPYSPSAWIILQSIINEWERKMIMQLLGVNLGKLLIAYHDSSDPPTQRYDDLIAPFDLQDPNFNLFPFNTQNPIHSSLGIGDFLAASVYFYYINDDQIKASQSGLVVADVETAKVLSPLGASKYAEGKWNSAIETAHAIQWFCQWKTDDTTAANIYPEFSGQYISPQYASLI